MTEPAAHSKSPSPQPSPGVPGEGANAANHTVPRRHSKRRVALAWAIAAGADALQIGGFPIFMAGDASPFNVALDVVVAIALIVLIGWHIAFIPTIFIESLPFADLAPTWTLAVLIATRSRTSRGDALPKNV